MKSKRKMKEFLEFKEIGLTDEIACQYSKTKQEELKVWKENDDFLEQYNKAKEKQKNIIKEIFNELPADTEALLNDFNKSIKEIKDER